MQPYQTAAQSIKEEGELPLKLVKSAASIAATYYGGGIALNKVLPLLSKYVPEQIAIAGLGKIDPRFRKFIDKGLKSGATFDQLRDFIKQKMMPDEEDMLEEIQQPQQKQSMSPKEAESFGAKKFKQRKKGLVEQEQERFQQQYGGQFATPEQSQRVRQQEAQNAYQAVIDAANRISQM